MSRRPHDLAGRRFGRLNVSHRHQGPANRGKAYWVCRCDCGAETIVPSDRLLSGVTKSCGCYRRDIAYAKLKSK